MASKSWQDGKTIGKKRETKKTSKGEKILEGLEPGTYCEVEIRGNPDEPFALVRDMDGLRKWAQDGGWRDESDMASSLGLPVDDFVGQPFFTTHGSVYVEPLSKVKGKFSMEMREPEYFPRKIYTCDELHAMFPDECAERMNDPVAKAETMARVEKQPYEFTEKEVKDYLMTRPSLEPYRTMPIPAIMDEMTPYAIMWGIENVSDEAGDAWDDDKKVEIDGLLDPRGYFWKRS